MSCEGVCSSCEQIVAICEDEKAIEQHGVDIGLLEALASRCECWEMSVEKEKTAQLALCVEPPVSVEVDAVEDGLCYQQLILDSVAADVRAVIGWDPLAAALLGLPDRFFIPVAELDEFHVVCDSDERMIHVARGRATGGALSAAEFVLVGRKAVGTDARVRGWDPFSFGADWLNYAVGGGGVARELGRAVCCNLASKLVIGGVDSDYFTRFHASPGELDDHVVVSSAAVSDLCVTHVDRTGTLMVPVHDSGMFGRGINVQYAGWVQLYVPPGACVEVHGIQYRGKTCRGVVVTSRCGIHAKVFKGPDWFWLRPMAPTDEAAYARRVGMYTPDNARAVRGFPRARAVVVALAEEPCMGGSVMYADKWLRGWCDRIGRQCSTRNGREMMSRTFEGRRAVTTGPGPPAVFVTADGGPAVTGGVTVPAGMSVLVLSTVESLWYSDDKVTFTIGGYAFYHLEQEYDSIDGSGCGDAVFL